MPKNANEFIGALPAARRRKIERRAQQLIREEMTLQELRRARKKTQAELANSLGIAQKQISKLEERTDMHISTLRRTVEAMGGRLTLVAEFPDRQPVSLSGITTQDVVAQPSFLSKPSHRKGVSRGAAGHPKSGGTKTRLRA